MLPMGDPPMCVALGEDFKPAVDISKTLGAPDHTEPDVLLWENIKAFTSDGVEIKCHGVSLQEFDFGDEDKTYLITCVGIYEPSYESLFPDMHNQYWNACD